MMVNKRRARRAPSFDQLSVKVMGPVSFHTPDFGRGLPSGVNSWLYFLNPPVRSNKHDSGQPSSRSNSIAFSERARSAYVTGIYGNTMSFNPKAARVGCGEFIFIFEWEI